MAEPEFAGVSPAGDELFRTARLSVRTMVGEHVDDLLRVYGDADAMRWVDDGQPIELAECERWVTVTARNRATRGYGMAALVLRETGQVVGFCGLVHPGGQLEVEVKYALDRDHWGRGLATEAVGGMIAWGAERFGIDRVIATLAAENRGSRRVLEKVGFAVEGTRVDDDGTSCLVMARGEPSSS